MPALSLKPPTSHGALARHTRHSQAAVASDSSFAVTLMQLLSGLLTRNGLAAAARRPPAPEKLKSGSAVRPERAAEAAAEAAHCMARSCVSRRTIALWDVRGCGETLGLFERACACVRHALGVLLGASALSARAIHVGLRFVA